MNALSYPKILFSLILIILSQGCAQEAARHTGKPPEVQATTPVTSIYTGKILGVSNKANTIAIEVTEEGQKKVVLVNFAEDTLGIENAAIESMAVINFELRENIPHALSIKPKLVQLPPGVEEIKAEEINSLLEQEANFLLIDSRPAKRYAQAHLPQAISLPVDLMSEKASQYLANDKDVLHVFYCGGPTCSMSPRAAKIAKDLGYTNIRVLLEGEPGWTQKGYPLYATNAFVETGNIVLLDLRDETSSAAARIPRSITIPFPQLESRLEEIPRRAPIVLYSEFPEDSFAALSILRQEQFKKVFLVEGGIEGWRRSGGSLESGSIVTKINWQRKLEKGEVSLAAFQQALANGENDITILDVRTNEEVAAGAPDNSVHIPLDELSGRKGELPQDKKIYVFCSTGARAEMAYRELIAAGFVASYLVANVECEGNDCEIEE